MNWYNSPRKGAIDEILILSFSVKSIMCRDVVGLDQWFADIKKMCQYLRFKGTLMQI